MAGFSDATRNGTNTSTGYGVAKHAPERRGSRMALRQREASDVAVQPPGGLITESNPRACLQRQVLASRARYFSCVGNARIVNPALPFGPPTMFICGNDNGAKREVKGFLDQFGRETADMGSVEAARAVEPLCMLWCIPGFRQNDGVHTSSRRGWPVREVPVITGSPVGVPMTTFSRLPGSAGPSVPASQRVFTRLLHFLCLLAPGTRRARSADRLLVCETFRRSSLNRLCPGDRLSIVAGRTSTKRVCSKKML